MSSKRGAPRGGSGHQPHTNARSAITGQYVTLEYARRHPRTTVIETVPPEKKN